eukprot:s2826_g4.t1
MSIELAGAIATQATFAPTLRRWAPNAAATAVPGQTGKVSLSAVASLLAVPAALRWRQSTWRHRARGAVACRAATEVQGDFVSCCSMAPTWEEAVEEVAQEVGPGFEAALVFFSELYVDQAQGIAPMMEKLRERDSTLVLAMEGNQLTLEKRFSEVKESEHVDILAEILIRCPDHHVCRSAVYGQTFVTNAPLVPGRATFSLLGATFQKGGRHPWLMMNPGTQVLQHEGIDMTQFDQVIEACAGIGAVSTAMPFCNASTSVYIDHNDKFCAWLRANTDKPVVHGDIGDPMVVKTVSDLTNGIPQPLTGGVSYQPFSVLGDQRQGQDPRSKSLPAILKMGYHLRAPVITLECTKEAMESEWAQKQIQEFVKCTGFRLHQTLLHLHPTWPSFRTRWWACLSHPSLGIQGIPNMPQHSFCPAVMNLMQLQPHLPPDEQEQLDLDRYELRQFHVQPNGIAASVLNSNKPMPTATHSFGSQLGPCLCGCRDRGFSFDRIHQKGLYGVLVPLGTMVKSGDNWWHGMRHLHPQEVAIFNGLDPRYVSPRGLFPLKLELAGVGQLASPLQGAWVFSNILFQIAKAGFPIQANVPRHVIARMCQELLEARDATWPHMQRTRFVQAFEHELRKLDTPVDESPTIQEHVNAQTHDTPELPQVVQAQAETNTPINLQQGRANTDLTSDLTHALPGALEVSTAPLRTAQVTADSTASAPVNAASACAPIRTSMSASDQVELIPVSGNQNIRSIRPFASDSPDFTKGSMPFDQQSYSELRSTRDVTHDHAAMKSAEGVAVAIPALPDAMSLPRLGCGDPSQCYSNQPGKRDDHLHTFKPDRDEHFPSPLPLMPSRPVSVPVHDAATAFVSMTSSKRDDHLHTLKPDRDERFPNPLPLKPSRPVSVPVHDAATAFASMTSSKRDDHLHTLKPDRNERFPSPLPSMPSRPVSVPVHDAATALAGMTSSTETTVYPTSPDAMSLPRLGCGDPSQCWPQPLQDHQANRHPANKAISMMKAEQDPGQTTPQTFYPEGRSAHDKDIAHDCHPLSITHNVIPALPDATSLPRLGCGDPSRFATSPNCNQDNHNARPASISGQNNANQENHRTHMPSHQVSEPTGEDDGPQVALAPNHAALATPALPDAMSLPRLGCGDPAHCESSSKSATQTTSSNTSIADMPRCIGHVYHPNGAIVTFYNLHNHDHHTRGDSAHEVATLSSANPAAIDGPDPLQLHDPWKKPPAPPTLSPAQAVETIPEDQLKLCDHGSTLNSCTADEAGQDEHCLQQHAQLEYEHALQPYTLEGGMQTFATHKRQFHDSFASPNEEGPVQKKLRYENPIQPDEPQPSTSLLSCPAEVVAAETSADHIEIWIAHHGQELYPVRILASATVGQVAQAEAKLHDLPPPTKVLSAVGTDVSVYHLPVPGQILVLADGQHFQPEKCPCIRNHSPPILEGMSREAALWRQRGWVAFDEMQFYLKMLQHQDFASTTEPIQLSGTPMDSTHLAEWMFSQVEANASDAHTKIFTACLHNHHWIPLCLDLQDDVIHLTTTRSDLATIQTLVMESCGPEVVFHSTMSYSAFHADCGFQTIAWILSLAIDEQFHCPMPVAEAIQWRTLFGQHICNQGIANAKITQLHLGGMTAEQHVQDLAALLTQHGVSEERVPTVIQQLVKHVGHVSLKATLGSSRPWADLKAKASACKPPLQLVLAEELQMKIAQRLQTGKPLGSKKTKAPKKAASDRWITPMASQVQIPPGIFQQQDGTLLHQVGINEIQAKQQGVVVLNIADAKPFLHLQAPLSKEGVGLLILEFQDEALPEQHQIVRFPATCPETQEPMILTAALVQLGSQSVMRNLPQQPAGIEQIETKVIRAVLFRDQYPHAWEPIVSKPVRTLLSMEHFASLPQQDILDVWDRQYMNKQYQKVRPDQAEVFSVVLRLPLPKATQLMTSNSVEGLYFEPRTQAGRAPSPSHRIIWLPKKNFADTVVARQATAIPTTIARAGDRFGLRAHVDQAPAVHRQHRPEVTYLDGSATKQYRIAPLPFGTTKKSLQQVIDTWEWSARASHTQGLTADKQGLVWVAHAVEPPKFWVFTMMHGDVLINEHAVQKPAQMSAVGAPVASTKTLRHLTATASTHKNKEVPNTRDPWLDNDPWASAYKAQVKQTAPSAHQLATIEANLHKKVMSAVQDQLAHARPAAEMEVDANTDQRVLMLEQQVQSLTSNMQQLTGSMTEFKHQQTSHNNQVAHQVQTLKQQADQQQLNMQSMLDKKMEEQMSRIEALLMNKRPKTGE